jgi:hypothetical protein
VGASSDRARMQHHRGGLRADRQPVARADVRLVAGEARDLPLDAELAAARDVLASAGIDVRMCVSADPSPLQLTGVFRFAIQSIISPSHCRRFPHGVGGGVSSARG